MFNELKKVSRLSLLLLGVVIPLQVFANPYVNQVKYECSGNTRVALGGKPLIEDGTPGSFKVTLKRAQFDQSELSIGGTLSNPAVLLNPGAPLGFSYILSASANGSEYSIIAAKHKDWPVAVLGLNGSSYTTGFGRIEVKGNEVKVQDIDGSVKVDFVTPSNNVFINTLGDLKPAFCWEFFCGSWKMTGYQTLTFSNGRTLTCKMFQKGDPGPGDGDIEFPYVGNDVESGSATFSNDLYLFLESPSFCSNKVRHSSDYLSYKNDGYTLCESHLDFLSSKSVRYDLTMCKKNMPKKTLSVTCP